MKNILFILTYLLVTLFLYQGKSNAYSPGIHRGITTAVIDQNEPQLNSYIAVTTGLPEGILASVNKKTIRKWIENGSYEEDNWRAPLQLLYGHFYNPITNVSGVGSIVPSAYDWANAPGNPWSWQKARDNFYKGLTLTTKTDRETALGNSFNAIGHVMHLVEDVSVPAHTRGDLHGFAPFNDNYEAYTDGLKDSLNYTSIPFPYWNESTVSGAPRQLWDKDSYNGQVIYGGDRIGLAEYTNANFFSDDTIFVDFTLPAWTSVIEYEDTDTAGKVTTYLKKTGDGEIINHLAAAKWFYKYLPSNFKRLGLKLDDRVSC